MQNYQWPHLLEEYREELDCVDLAANLQSASFRATRLLGNTTKNTVSMASVFAAPYRLSCYFCILRLEPRMDELGIVADH